MKLCNTTGAFSLHFNNEIDKLKELHASGFRYVDFSMYSDQTRAFMHDNWKEDIKKIKETADELGLTFVQAHSPAFETLETLDPNENWDEKYKETIRSIEICKELSIPMTVIHAGVKRNTSKEETLELNKKFYASLFPVMEETGVNVLVENVGAQDNEGRYYLNDGYRLKEFVEYVDHPLIHACWDIGHGNAMMTDQYNDIMALEEHLYAIHYNDNNAKDDEHRIPFLGKVNQKRTMQALIDVKFKGPFTFEADGGLKSKLLGFYKMLNNKDLSLDVIRAEQKLLFEMGKYLLNSFGIYEE